VAAALHNPDVRALRSELEQRGYTLDLGHSLGYQNRNSGMRAELFMFVSPSDSNDTAVLTWSSTGSGQEKAFADTRRVNPAASLPDNYSDLTPDQALQWVQANVQTTRLTAQTGAVSPDFSLSGPCFDQCVLRMCGSAALTCLIASIGYLECLGFLCGGYYLICASTC